MSISPQTQTATSGIVVEICASGLDIHVPGIDVSDREKAKRGKITGFSKKSRARMRKMLLRVDFDEISSKGKNAKRGRAFFVTLTYPKLYSENWQDWKRDLDTFSKRMRRLPGFKWALWKLERQKRGAPHYHIVVVFDRERDKTTFKDWLLASWHKCINTDDTKHRYIGADVKTLYNSKHNKLMSYMLKYLGKVDYTETPKGMGRIWGCWGEMPTDPVFCAEFATRKDWVEFVRRIRKWGKHSRYLRQLKNRQGVVLVGRGVDLWTLARGLEFRITTEHERIEE